MGLLLSSGSVLGSQTSSSCRFPSSALEGCGRWDTGEYSGDVETREALAHAGRPAYFSVSSVLKKVSPFCSINEFVMAICLLRHQISVHKIDQFIKLVIPSLLHFNS